MGMGFLDTAMAGHYASAHQAGVGVGSLVLWPTFLLLAGFTMSITPIAAQLVGGGRSREVGAAARQGLLVAAAASVPAAAIVALASALIERYDVDAEMAAVAADYLYAGAFGLPAGLCYILLRSASEGLGRAVGPMVIAASALVVNGILNYVLIYGAFGAPELGGAGCGWATAITLWFELGCALVLARRPLFVATGFWNRFDGPDWRQIGHILKVGVPIGLAAFMGMALFSFVGLLVAQLGVESMAAHTIASHIAWATYVLPMALGTAAGIRIGFYVGAGDLPAAAGVARIAFLLSLCYAVAVSVLLVLLRLRVAAIYNDDPAVTSLVASLIFVIAFYQVFDDTQATMSGALRGYKDTRAPMVYAFIGYWIVALPLGWALGFGRFGLPSWGVFGFWVALSLGLALVTALDGLRLARTSADPRRIARLSG